MLRASLLLLAGLGLAGKLTATPPAPMISAADSSFRYEGRFDASDPAQPVAIWAGDRITVDFEGVSLAVVFGAATGQNFFNVTVDGAVEIAGVAEGPAHRYAWPRPLGAGWHRLEIFKRSEADAGHAAFRGLELAAGAGVRPAPPPAYRLRLQFIGDSITVGANNEDGAVDQWEDRRTHNHALSYGHLTSRALGADHRAVAVSGMGLCEGFVPMHAGETWDRLYPRDKPARADLKSWVPDVVCVNLGENDDAFPRANNRPFPPGYTAAYVALIHAVRAAWPQAHIVLLRGGMGGGARSAELRQAWEAAVRELEAGDRRVSHYVFQHWSQQHPRVSDHRVLVGELTSWLKQQPFMAAFLHAAAESH